MAADTERVQPSTLGYPGHARDGCNRSLTGIRGAGRIGIYGGPAIGPRNQGRVRMRKLMKRLAVVSLVGMPVVGGVIVPAGPSGAATRVRAVISTKAGPDTLPNSTIKGKGKKSKYKPTRLSAAEGTQTTCTNQTFTSFTLTNPGKATEYVTIESAPGTYTAFGPLSGKSEAGICIYGGSAGGTVIFGLSNSTGSVNYKSHLTVTAID